MSRRTEQNVVALLKSVIPDFLGTASAPYSPTSQLKQVRTAPGCCYACLDELTSDRSHSFAFQLDQTRRVSIDVANQRRINWLTGWLEPQDIEVILWSEFGYRQVLFTVAPDDRNRETLVLRTGRYLLELKTHAPHKRGYALQLTALKWLLLDCLAS
jgi:hypothetical protein